MDIAFQLLNPLLDNLLQPIFYQPINKVIVLSDYQTKGRGKPGNLWLNKYNDKPNFLCSIGYLTHSSLYNSNIHHDTSLFSAELPIIYCLAVGETIFELLPNVDIKYKYPNDIFALTYNNNSPAGYKKIGGILIEQHNISSEKNTIYKNIIGKNIIGKNIIGIGVNLNSHPDSLFSTDLYHISGININNKHFLKILLKKIQFILKLKEQKGFDYLIKRWSNNLIDQLSLNSYKKYTK